MKSTIHAPAGAALRLAAAAMLMLTASCLTTRKGTGKEDAAAPPRPVRRTTPLVLPEPESGPIIPGKLDSAAAAGQIIIPARNFGDAPPPGRPKVFHLAAAMTREKQNADETIPFLLELDGADMEGLVGAFAKNLDFQYNVSGEVSGTFNLSLQMDISRREAWDLFEHILWLNGAYATQTHGYIEILPFAKMPKERRLFADHDPIPNVAVELIRLYNVTAAEMANHLKPYMTDGATATPLPHLNALLVVEAPPNMNKLQELISRLDLLGETRWPQVSVRARFVDVETLQEEISAVLSVLGFPVGNDKSDGRSVKLVTLPRHQILLAAAPTKAPLLEVLRWAEILDNEETGEDERIYFYDVKYNKAEDLSDAIGVFFTASATTASSNSNTSASSSASSTDDKSTTSAARTSTRPKPRTGASEEAPKTVFDIPVTMLADGSHNRLIIRTTPKAFAMLEALLRRLDTPPLQVLIQVTIAEVQLNTNLNYNLNKIVSSYWGNDVMNLNAGGGGVTFNLGPNLTAESALNTITADESVTDSRVLFRPQIIGISDVQQTIDVGDKVSVITEGDFDSTDLDNTTSTRNTYQYIQTGTKLKVTPHITTKRMVTLEIEQELSRQVPKSPEEAKVNANPDIRNRSVSTTMIARDGELLMLAGLLSFDRSDTDSGIPFVNRVPVIGSLLGSVNRSKNATELLMLIEVRVLDTTSDHQQLLEPYRKSLDSINTLLPDSITP